MDLLIIGGVAAAAFGATVVALIRRSKRTGRMSDPGLAREQHSQATADAQFARTLRDGSGGAS